jgi:hypothetical protein
MFRNTPNVLEPIAGCTELIPRWAHPDAAVAYSGLGRTYLFGLIKAGEIASVRIAKNNNPRGRAHRLIDLRSVDAWIESHAQNGGRS